jgi:hypothetical protein
MRAEVNYKETKRTIEKVNERKSWFFERLDKIDKSLAKLTKERKRKS